MASVNGTYYLKLTRRHSDIQMSRFKAIFTYYNGPSKGGQYPRQVWMENVKL